MRRGLSELGVQKRETNQMGRKFNGFRGAIIVPECPQTPFWQGQSGKSPEICLPVWYSVLVYRYLTLLTSWVIN